MNPIKSLLNLIKSKTKKTNYDLIKDLDNPQKLKEFYSKLHDKMESDALTLPWPEQSFHCPIGNVRVSIDKLIAYEQLPRPFHNHSGNYLLKCSRLTDDWSESGGCFPAIRMVPGLCAAVELTSEEKESNSTCLWFAYCPFMPLEADKLDYPIARITLEKRFFEGIDGLVLDRNNLMFKGKPIGKFNPMDKRSSEYGLYKGHVRPSVNRDHPAIQKLEEKNYAIVTTRGTCTGGGG